MKNKAIFLFISIVFGVGISLFSQENLMNAEYIKRLDKILLSPQATAFQKYAYYPVSPSTGTVNISVPIYTIKQGELSIPISLDYHTGGIRVNDTSTSVGLGWLLNAGGVITRNKQGSRADEDYKGYLKNRNLLPSREKISRIRRMSDYAQEKIDFFYFCKNVLGVNNQTFLGQGLDLEPDLFSYNFAGHTGVFYFSTSGKVITENKEPLRIEMIDNYGFKVTDEKGVIYFFENKTQSVYKVNVKSELKDGSNMYLFHKSGTNNLPYGDFKIFEDEIFGWSYIGTTNMRSPAIGEHQTINAWYLTKIVHPNNRDIIYFDYKTVRYESPKFISQSKEVIYDRFARVQDRFYDLNLIENSFSNFVTDQILTKIRFSLGEVTFNYAQDRIDSNGKDRLKSITCKDINGQVVKNVQLDNNRYFVANYGRYSNDDKDNKRLKLQKVIFKNKNSLDYSFYEFAYNESLLPPLNSKAVDHWGYFNGVNNNSLVPKILLDGEVVLGDADKRANADKMKAFILNKVTYPTGGMTTIDYSPHKAFSSRSNKFAINIGGLRVSRMRMYPNKKNMTEFTEKKFNYYYKGFEGVGKPISNVGAEFNFQFSCRDGDHGTIYSKSIVVNSSPVYSINIPQFSNVLYDRVVEEYRDIKGNNNGYNEIIFDLGESPYHYHDAHTSGGLVLLNVSDYYDPEHLTFRALNSYGNAFFVPVMNYYPVSNRPYLLKESLYDKNGVKIKETSKGYSLWSDTREKVKGFYLSSYKDYKTSVPIGVGSGDYLDYFPDKYYYFLYEIPIGKRLLTFESEYTLTPKGGIRKNTNYEYEYTNGMLRRVSLLSSEGKSIVTENWYSFDYLTAELWNLMVSGSLLLYMNI